METTPGVKQLYDAQCRLIGDAQKRLGEMFAEGGSTQHSQSLAKAILDLVGAQAKLAPQLHPATKVER